MGNGYEIVSCIKGRGNNIINVEKIQETGKIIHIRHLPNNKFIFNIHYETDFEIVDKAFGYESEEDIIREESTYPDIEINNLESSSSSSSNNSNNDYDKLLDSYEEYVDQYLKFAKKAVNDDMSAMSEYAVLMEKMTHLAESLDNAKGNMSSRQMKRYLDITNKYATGLTEISE